MAMEKSENTEITPEKTGEQPVQTTGQKKQKSIVGKGISLSILTLLSRILGLVREMTKSHFLGTSGLSDAFAVAFLVPNICRRLFAENSISVAFIPTFKTYLETADTKDGKKDTQDFINATFTVLCFVTVIFVSLGIILTPLILKIFYFFEKNISTESYDEAVILTRIMFPYLVVISIAAFFQGILNGLKIFSPSGFTPILFNGIVIASTYILSPHTANPARAMAIGVVSGGVIQALFQLPFVLKNDWRLYFTTLKKAFSNPGTKKVLKLIAPTILGMAAYQLNDIVSTSVATNWAKAGTLSSLQYSLRLQELILGIFAVTIGTVILPDLSGFARKENWKDFNDMLSSSVKIMTLISIPVTFYCLFMGENIVALVYYTGKFNDESLKMTSGIFLFHIIGLLFIAINRIIAPAFYAQSDTKNPTIAGLISVAVNIILAIALVFPMGGRGIALALTVSSAMNTVLLFIMLSRKKNMNMKSLLSSSLLYALRILVFSIIASVPVYFLRTPLINIFAGHNRFISQGMPVLISAIIFAAVGVILLAVTKDPLLKAIVRKIKK